MPDRRTKIAALLDSPVAGEREAAQAALARIAPSPDDWLQTWPAQPAVGSREWEDARAEWRAHTLFCMARLASPILTQAEKVTIQSMHRHVGHPWCAGSYAFHVVYRKLLAEEERQCRSRA